MLDARELAERHAAELLGRPLLGPPPAQAAESLAGRRVLVTGAAGSIGPRLTDALLAGGAAEVQLVDHHEASLFNLFRRFGGQADRVHFVLADVRDRRRLAETLRDRRPEVVVHLAAFKHVPFGEAFPTETVAVNVLATRQLLDLAAEHGVERFVYPSSDKACAPPSLYGATKRLGEWLAKRAARRGGMLVNVARYVNILGTQGSVVETLVQQVAAGRPLGLTDPAMTRYWIAMSEALWLALTAATTPASGQTLMLDAREEVPLVEMARRVARLVAGPAGEDYPVEFGGSRPGERLHERLLADEERFEPGPVEGILRVAHAGEAVRLEQVESVVDRVACLLERGDGARLKAEVMRAAAELQ